jgi:raffinose/stachyose/melibiose transport system substrate-binding protein
MKLEKDRPFPANINVDYSKALPIEQQLAEAMANAGFFTFMHVDHAFEPAIANAFLDATQALVGGAMTPEEAAQATEDEAVRVRGEVE